MERPDFAYYSEVYGGRYGKEAFQSQLNEAAALVYEVIGFKSIEGKEDAVLDAICAAVDSLLVCGGVGASGGFSIGSFSVSGSGTAEDTRSNVRKSFMYILVDAGLAFQGV